MTSHLRYAVNYMIITNSVPAKILMTPMRHMVVPPPMSSYQLQLPSAVNQVVFATPPNSNDLVAVLEDQRIAVFKFDGMFTCRF